MKINLQHHKPFEQRHNGQTGISEMLKTVGVNTLDELIEQTVPSSIRLAKPLHVTKEQSEYDFLRTFKKIAEKNKVFRSYIGTGYYDTLTPNVILRNILENPAWYTAYTPYQAEIAQGRLEALIGYSLEFFRNDYFVSNFFS